MPTLSQLLASSTDPSTSNVLRKSPNSTVSTAATGTKLPTVRDLAIQPTQRVMRYVLLYKDLFNSTPVVSPARGPPFALRQTYHFAFIPMSATCLSVLSGSHLAFYKPHNLTEYPRSTISAMITSSRGVTCHNIISLSTVIMLSWRANESLLGLALYYRCGT
ncbi:hypothetical protein JB92DRAFT_112483 [Gautieria morchelliformis]|nr:hypothetical protein JB92DRAFT_112483 [Gautieria morchelliformis]